MKIKNNNLFSRLVFTFYLCYALTGWVENMYENYLLKHKNIPILRFSIDTDNFEAIELHEILIEERLPFILGNGNKEYSCLSRINRWLENRGLTESREDYVDMLFETGASSGKELSVNSLGLNLSDHYWLHKEKFDLKWEKLNFFDNKFKEVILKGLFDSKDDTSNIHPDFSVDGRLIKKWTCHNNERYLLKEGGSKDEQEPHNEVVASKILDFYNIDHVEYDIKKINNRIVSVCKCMVDGNTELIPAKFVFDKGGKIKDNPYNHFINVCNEHGIKNARIKLDEMIILDCIIGNEDRHKRNFGIIRNSDSLKWLKIAPIFDNGNSFCFRDGSKMENLEKRTDSYCKWFEMSNMRKLEHIDCTKWFNNINKNIIIDIVSDGFSGKIKNEKKDKIITITKNRLDFIEKLLLERRKTITTGFNIPSDNSLTPAHSTGRKR